MGDPKIGIEVRAMEALGCGFDLASDFRLKYAKRGGGERLVVLDEGRERDVVVPGGPTIRGVPEGIRCDKGDRMRFRSDVLEFNQMSELLNQRCSVQGKVPSGYLNSLFDLSGAWLNDAADAKYLAFDGYFISLYHLHLTASPLVLHDKVKKSVPSHWNPELLSRFIRTFGTHIIVGMAIGGQDLLCVKQNSSSTIPQAELKGYLEDVGDCLFSDGMNPSLLEKPARDRKQKVPDVFKRMLESHTRQLISITETSTKDGLTISRLKRGGDIFSQSHSNWLQTVAASPEAILFKFVPITSLLTGIPGSGYLSHAINLYLRYKPVLKDLQYFLEFQIPRQWAPLFCELPLRHQRKIATCPPLQFNFMGSKLRVNPTQVSTSKKPVIGMRLYLEGKKNNLLAVHVQHLSSLPNTMISKWANLSTNHNCQWRGSDDYDPNCQFLEPIKWRKYANICTSAVKHDPSWLKSNDPPSVFIVTGAQLITKGKWPKNTLHLRLLFSRLPYCTIGKTEWASAPESNKKSIFMNFSTTFTNTQKALIDPKKKLPEAMNSGVYPEGPPVPIRSGKLLKYVDIDETVRGPHDAPGHWLVTAAQLVTEGGKIGLLVKFALLDYEVE